jgi:hypothetical protein
MINHAGHAAFEREKAFVTYFLYLYFKTSDNNKNRSCRFTYKAPVAVISAAEL